MSSTVLLCCVVSLFMFNSKVFVVGLLVGVGDNDCFVIVVIEFIVALY